MMRGSPERVMARYLAASSGRPKTAAFPPGPPQQDKPAEGSNSGRNIPKDHDFQARALKPLSKALWASTVALGHTLTAYRHLSRLKSATVSPDGQMGGRGYVMKLSEMRQRLYEASEALSQISDTIFDEINGPHWKPKLAQLDESDQEDVTRFVEEAQEVMENPEGEAEDEIEEIEAKSKPKAKKKKKPAKADADASGLPSADDTQDESEVHDQAVPGRVKEASQRGRPAGMADKAWMMEFYGSPPPSVDALTGLYVTVANSAQPVSDMPGGPRVDHIGPGAGSGAFGDFNPSEVPPVDDDTRSAARWKAAGAGLPDSSTDDTPTTAWDFGVGYGARGEAAGGHANPSDEGRGKGVWGPHSGLPGTPPQSSGDATAEGLDLSLNRRAFDALYGTLPQDVAGDVARADYYPGAKDNQVTVGQSVSDPNTVLESQLPTPEDTRGESGQRLLNTYYTLDDVDTPYERYDYATHTLREPDGLSPGQNHQEPFAPDGEATR